MNTSEAIKVLKDHQRWRLGGDNKATNPKDLTRAIDTAIKILKQFSMDE